jgi:hypothetical protein
MSILRYDPFDWRLHRLHDSDAVAGRDHDARLDAIEDELRDELLVVEAEELAHGRRHLTIAHGPLIDVIDRDHHEELLATIDTLAATTAWRRITTTDTYVTVTVAGPDATRVIDAVAHAGAATNPGSWHIIASARPATN